MKKWIFGLMLAICSISLAQAQRMLPGQKALELNVGTVAAGRLGKNCFVNLALTTNARNGNYKLWAMEYAYAFVPYRKTEVPVETYSAEGGYSIHLLGDALNTYNFHAALSGIVGYEASNGGTPILYDGAMLLNKGGFIYGAGCRLSLETYLSDNFVLLLHGRVKTLWGISMRPVRPAAGLGLRFNF